MDLLNKISPLVPAIAAACFGVLAGIVAQLAFAQGRAADPARYFGGYAITPDMSERGLRRDGARERAGLRAALYQSTVTAFLVATSLLSLSAAAYSVGTAVIGLLGAFIGIGQPIFGIARWWRLDRRITAQTEYYVLMQGGGKELGVDGMRRLFAERHPTLRRWI